MSLGACGHQVKIGARNRYQYLLEFEDWNLLGEEPTHNEVVEFVKRQVTFWKCKYHGDRWFYNRYKQALIKARRLGLTPEDFGLTEDEVKEGLPWWDEMEVWHW